MKKEFMNKHIAELILSNEEMTADDLLDYLEVPIKLRSNFLVSSIMNGFHKIIDDYDTYWGKDGRN